MSWETWALFLVTEALLCLTPGPAVLFVVSQGLGGGVAAALWANAGINAGNGFYFLVSVTGLGAILLASYDLFFAVKWAGAAYLVWLGVRALWGGDRGPLAVRAAERAAGPRVFARGFAVQAANPKAVVFFTALLPQFIDATSNVPLQVAILAVTSLAVEFLVLGGYGALAGRAAQAAVTPRMRVFLERAAGAVLIAAGVRMAVLRQAG